MVKLLTMCGLQCSGKSTETERLAKEYNAVVLSSDQLRKEHPEWNNDTVFRTLYARMNNLLSLNTNVILDATNITIKSRKQIFLNLKVDCEKICYIMNTPFNECMNRLKIRNMSFDSHKVPEEVLEAYHKSFEIPFYEEGWDTIILHNIPKYIDSENTLLKLKMMADGFNQQNHHHTQDLGKHMQTVADILKDTNNSLMIKAAEYHDVGKLFTQTKGNDGDCHYYNHDSVGTYTLLCNCGIYTDAQMVGDSIEWEFNIIKTLRWLFYINYHMKLHNVVTEKSIKKWTSIFGEKLYNDLRAFEKADKFRG